MPEKLSAAEQQRRAAILRDIERRMAEDGPRTARPYQQRARQFMPFAALRGYSGMVRQAEGSLTRIERHQPTEEEAAALSAVAGSLTRGNRVCLQVFSTENGAYHQMEGAIDEVAPALGALRMGGTWIAFEDIATIERQ